MTDKPDETQKIANGTRVRVEICGEVVDAGFNRVFGVPQLAYLPTGSTRPDPETRLTIDDEAFLIKVILHSDYVPKMVVLVLEDVDG